MWDHSRFQEAIADFVDMADFRRLVPENMWRDDPEMAAILGLRRSGCFSSEGYLANNPDVRNSGLDAVEHWVRFGIFENRKPVFFAQTKIFELPMEEQTEEGVPEIPADAAAVMNVEEAELDVIRLYENTYRAGDYKKCLYLLDSREAEFNASPREIMQRKRDCLQRTHEHLKLIHEIEKYRAQSGDDYFDYDYIEAFWNEDEYDRTNEIIANLKKDAEIGNRVHMRLHKILARLAYQNCNYQVALSHVESALLQSPDDIRMLEWKTKLLACQGLFKESVKTATHLYGLTRKQTHFDMLMQLRHGGLSRSTCRTAIIVNLKGKENIEECISLSLYFLDKINKRTPYMIVKIVFICDTNISNYMPMSRLSFTYEYIQSELSIAELLSIWSELKCDWVGFLDAGMELLNYIEHVQLSLAICDNRSGAIVSDKLSLYRKTPLTDFVYYYCDKFDKYDINGFFNKFHECFFVISDNKSIGRVKYEKILFVTPIGICNYGGGEQFLLGMISILNKQYNLDINVIAFSQDHKDTWLYRDKTYFVKSYDDLTHIIYDINPDLIWSLTSENMSFTDSFKYIKAHTIMGNHYYNAFLLDDIGKEFKRFDENIRRRSFDAYMTYIDSIYVNSIYTQRFILDRYHAALPMIYSLPHKFPLDFVPLEHRAYVLIVNTRIRKGFDLFVQIAARLPHIKFVALASQSSADYAMKYCRRHGAYNVEIYPFQENMGGIYAQAKVVLVPSYNFVETFSRAAIEAQTHGIPVIASNVGNLPYLLENSGISLPMDVNLWTDEIKHLYEDDCYYLERAEKAFNNVKQRYNFAIQPARLARLLKYSNKRILIVLGGNLSQMLAASAIAGKISREYNTPVDILLERASHSAAILFANSPLVNAVYEEYGIVKNRYYDLVFICSATSIEFAKQYFSSACICRPQEFIECSTEIISSGKDFELLESQLGIRYDTGDERRFAVLPNPFPPAKDAAVIGLHSDSGSLMRKLFGELTQMLDSAGYQVVSLGLPHEYIPGTVNQTSSDFWDISQSVQKCGHIISADSWLAHLADCLGSTGIIASEESKSQWLYGKGWLLVCAPTGTGLNQATEEYLRHLYPPH